MSPYLVGMVTKRVGVVQNFLAREYFSVYFVPGRNLAIFTGQNSLPPPNNVRVVEIPKYAATQRLAFNWSSAILGWNSCPTAHYVITSINCGNCADSTVNNNVTCQNAVLGAHLQFCRTLDGMWC